MAAGVDLDDDQLDEQEEQVDYTNSQDSVESFKTRIEKFTGRSANDENADRDTEEAPRRCDRLKMKEDVRVADLAKERAAAKNNYGNSDDLDVFTCSNLTLATMASAVGIDLGCSLEMINTNIDIMRILEQARQDIMNQVIANDKVEEIPSSPVHIDTGDADLDDLCSDGENDAIGIHDLGYAELRQIFSAKKKWKSSPTAMSCVKIAGFKPNKNKKGKY